MTKPITNTLHKIGDGVFLDASSNKMAELVQAVKETGRQGKLTLTIVVKKATVGGAMHITGTPTLTLPKPEPMETMLFATEEGDLTEDNPKQQRLDLKSVPETETVELKQINKDK